VVVEGRRCHSALCLDDFLGVVVVEEEQKAAGEAIYTGGVSDLGSDDG
jgi:hypothetical protein